jgi:VWFA-related protein
MSNRRNRLHNLHLYSVALLSFVACTWAQISSSGSAIPPPTIRLTTHMVLVDVVVTDKQGRSVPGLRPEDFTVEENGKPQKISSFVTAGENSPPPAPILGPGIYSNRAQYRAPGGPITVLLLDALNTPFVDQAYARRQMLRFVEEQYKPGERMGIFTLTGALNVLQDFTSDPRILYAAMQRYRPLQQKLAGETMPATSAEPGPGTAQSTVASLDASSQAPSDSSGDGGAAGLRGGGGETVLMATALAAAQAFEGAQIAYAEDQRALLTLNALNSLGRILGGILGRKNLIWVTANLPFSFIPEDRTMTDAELAEDLPSMNTRRVGEHASGNYAATFRQSHAEEIRETADRLANAQVAVYPVDARGLSISTDTDSQEAMREMARETGGRAYVNQNEIRIGIERAFQDDAAAYTLGYYPENKKYDGKYRQIKVKVKREGVEFQNRRGYYALDPTLTKGYNPNQEVAAALDDTIPATLIAFTVRVQPPASNSVKGKLGVDFLVDVNTVSTEGISGNKKLNVLFYAMLYSSDGKMLSNQSMKVDQSFNNETYQNIVQHGMLLHMDVEPKTGGSQLRLAVQDNRTGLVGTIRAPVSNP